MTRISKQSKRRMLSPKNRKKPSPKTGPKKDLLEMGYKEHFNAVSSSEAKNSFIARVK